MKKSVLPLLVVVLAFCLISQPVTAATDAEIEQAIGLGLAWLAAQQTLPDGYWDGSDRVGRTGLAVKKFEHYAVHELKMNPLDPAYIYYDQVKHGLDYIFSMLLTRSIGMQGANNPDSDADGIGLYASGAQHHRTYETGVALMAIAESNCPDSVVDVPSRPVDGWTYYDVAIDLMDWLAMAQAENNGRGGWGYAECDNGTWTDTPRSDNSLTGYATLGLAFAQAGAPDGFGIPLPQFVKDELAIWIGSIQCLTAGTDYGGSGYTSSCDWVNCLKTGNLLQEMKLVGQKIGSDANADLAVDYLVNHWADAGGGINGTGWLDHYQAMFCVMKGLEFQGVKTIDGIDWYFDIADHIVATQNVDNSWGPDPWGDKVLATAWALLTLEKAAPPPDFRVCIDSTAVMPGYHAKIHLTWCDVPEIGGFDFLVCYDQSGLYFLEASPMGVVADWEYFTYRHYWQDNCGGGCPSGYIRLIGIANMYDCHDPGDVFNPEDGRFAELVFQTSQDFNFVGQAFHLNYCWLECRDNTVSSKDGEILYMARDIALFLPDEDCVVEDKGYIPNTLIEFCHGVVHIVPPEDDRGDINLNGIANEIADAVIFANSFIYGWGILGYPNDPYWENRKLATDVNNDGVPLTVADLVYLIRIITGDANPFPEDGEGKIAPFANAADLSYTIGEHMVVKTHSTVNVGAAAFVFRHTGYELGVPVLTDAVGEMTIRFADRDGELRVLVFSMENNSINSGSYDLFTVPTAGEGTIELVEVQFSDAKGNMLAVNMTKVSPPSAFALMQNYPNPFNAGTVIRFALPDASDWSLKIYNVVGQLVREFKGQAEAGLVSVHWDATNAASGIYFYKLTADKFTDTRKMILMK